MQLKRLATCPAKAAAGFLMPASLNPTDPRGPVNDEVGAMAIPSHLVPRSRIRPSDLWREAGSEPTLAEALSDPIVHAVMRRDGVTFGELVCVIARAQVKLRRGLCCLAA